jgi:hypothetical protein
MAARSVWNIWTRFRDLFSRRTRNEFDDTLAEFLTGDALYNRAALYPETLSLYHAMFSVFSEPRETQEAQDEQMRLFGQRSFHLISALARQSGKPAPDTKETMIVFLKDDLRGFDTAEATELRERMLLNKMRGLLKG